MIYIALLRGINVGGHNRIKMGDLRQLLKSAGLANVQTYLASGNVVFESDDENKQELVKNISVAIEKEHDFNPDILLLTLNEVQTAAEENPFPEAAADPKSLHLGFLADKPSKPDLEKINSLKKESERFKLKDKIFYLHAPEGIGRSKLAAGSEKALGVAMTDRNWRTIRKVIELAKDS